MARDVWFQIVDSAGRLLTSADCVTCVDNVKVYQLRNAIKKKCPNTLFEIDASSIRVFGRRASFKAKQPQLKSSSSLRGLGVDEDNAILVVVPACEDPLAPERKRQRTAAVDSQLKWRKTPRAQLVLNDDDQWIELAPECMEGSGIHVPGKSLMLYRRPYFVKQWDEIYRCCIRTYAHLWIVGPAGSGKSCAAFAFVWSLDPQSWDALWLHDSSPKDHIDCVWLNGGHKFSRALKKSAIYEDLRAILNQTSQKRKTVVVLDGCTTSAFGPNEVTRMCIEWHQADKMNHRLVTVSSTRPRDYERNGCHIIPSTAEESDGSPITPKTREGDDAQDSREARVVYNEMEFKVDSWRLEEYAEAISNRVFFRYLGDQLPEFKGRFTERTNSMTSKYFVAGGNARFMFETPTEVVLHILNDVIDETSSVYSRLDGHLPYCWEPSYLLITRFTRPDGLGVSWMVSQYVLRRFAVKSLDLRRLVQACAADRSIDGHLFDAWFFSELSQRGLDIFSLVETMRWRSRWAQCVIQFFDPCTRQVRVSLDDPTWIAPMRWSEGAYDAVFLDMTRGLVRFVQLARKAGTHCSFEPEEYVALLPKLCARALGGRIAKVEMCFVFPMDRLESPQLPVDEVTFKQMVVDAVTGRETHLLPKTRVVRVGIPFTETMAF